MNKDKLDSALETVNELHGETLEQLENDPPIVGYLIAVSAILRFEGRKEWADKIGLAASKINKLKSEVKKYKAIASKAIREQIDVRKDEQHYNKIKSWEEDGWGCTLDEALQMWSPGDVRELPPSGTVNLIKHALAEIKRIRAENEKLKLDFMQAVETELKRHHPMLERLRAENEKLRADKAAWQGVQQGTADVVKQLEAENEKLRAALKPFADKADHHTQGAYWMDAIFTVDECRAAVKALENTK